MLKKERKILMTKENLHPSPTRFSKDSFNMNVDTINHAHLAGSYDFNAPYQRGLIWTPQQKERLITSVAEWIPINAVYYNEYSEDRPYEIIDGKQRLTTILSYLNDEFTWRGHHYSELPPVYRSIIKSFNISVHMTRYKTEDQCERLFDLINFAGTPHQR